MEKIAVFGSAFNPPSLGHKSVIESLSHFDRILLVPSIAHAWGKEMLDFETRCQLINAFIDDLSLEQADLSQVELARIEEELYTPGESVTTFAVLNYLKDIYPNADITFVIGPDNFFKFGSFYKAQEITQQWTVMACPEKVHIRSTDIRNALANDKQVTELTTKSVANMLHDNALYKIM